MKFLLLLTTILTVGSLSIVVRANDVADATQLFAEGTAAFDKERYDEAAEKFRAANAIKYNWKLLYNIAQAEAAAKRFGLALETFEIYIAEGGDRIPVARLDEVHQEVRRLRNVTGSLEIEAPDGCVVEVDAVKRGVTPLAGSLLVAAGVTHDVVITKDGKEMLKKSIKVNGGQSRKISIENAAENQGDATESSAVAAESDATLDDAPATAQSEGDSGRGLRLTGVILLGTGVAALIGGGITGGIAVNRNNSFKDECGDAATVACSATAQQNLDDSLTAGNISTALFIGGSVLATTGVVLLIVGKKRNSRAKALPAVGPTFAGVQLVGNF